MSNFIKQQTGCKIKQTIKTVEWLVNNTEVRTFNKITFEGYQRSVTPSHVKGIVDYLNENDFYLPTSIICSSDAHFNDSTKLFIVDGQHRVKAFEEIRKEYPDLYNKIKSYEISVIVLENPDIELEIDTFITINKTSKPVDTSLALILRNRINQGNNSDNLSIAQKEYLAVELGINLTQNQTSNWYNKILLEGFPSKNTKGTISLNSFVRSTKVLISSLSRYKILNTEWKDENELDNIIFKLTNIYEYIWISIRERWPNLFNFENKEKNVLQGTIGVSAMNKYIILQLKRMDKELDEVTFKEHICKWIKGIDIDEAEWYSGNQISKYSSESGFNLVANMIYDNYSENS